MFNHHGGQRTHAQNLGIASLLSFVAGFVNVVGFMSVGQLTTNVTGHFAFFMGDVRDQHWGAAFVFFLFIFAFLAGAFVSNSLIEWVDCQRKRNIYRLPIIVEVMLLALVALGGPWIQLWHSNLVALLLLFAMGLQNALVTRISKAVVRTTHLTGLFTDLGIELSQWFFYSKKEERARLQPNIQLRLLIISSFFGGGLVGGLLYLPWGYGSLLLPCGLLLLGLWYDQKMKEKPLLGT